MLTLFAFLSAVLRSRLKLEINLTMTLPISSEAKAVQRKNIAKERTSVSPKRHNNLPWEKKIPTTEQPKAFTEAKGTHRKVTLDACRPLCRRPAGARRNSHQSTSHIKCADDAAPNGVTPDHYVARAVTGSSGMGVKRRPITQHRPPPL